MTNEELTEMTAWAMAQLAELAGCTGNGSLEHPYTPSPGDEISSLKTAVVMGEDGSYTLESDDGLTTQI